MPDRRIIDFASEAAKRTRRGGGGEDGELLVICPHCHRSNKFSALLRIENGEAIVSHLICFSRHCRGETEIPIEGVEAEEFQPD